MRAMIHLVHAKKDTNPKNKKKIHWTDESSIEKKETRAAFKTHF